METTLHIVVPFSILFLLMVLGMPVGFALGVAGSTALFVFYGHSILFSYLATTPLREVAQYTLAAIPLFILMGAFVFEGGISQDLFDVFYKWVGRIPGGLAIATIFTAAAFGTVSGSTASATAAVGRVAYPEMRRFNYDKLLALGCVASSGTFDIMIPPSIVFIVYGVLTGVSIGKLFMGGFLPGLLNAFVFVVYVYLRVKRKPSLAPLAPRFSWKERITSLKTVWAVAILVLIVLGGIYLGVMSPTEASALGAMGAFIIMVVRKRGVPGQASKDALVSSITTSGMIFMTIIGAFIFGYFITFTKLPQTMVGALAAMAVSRWIILVIILFVYLILGCFFSQLSILVLTVPLVFPVITNLGFDPIWFGIIFTMTAEIGQLTPPMAIAVFVLQGVTHEPLELCYKAVFPFVVIDFFVLAILIIFPQISLFLPNMMT